MVLDGEGREKDRAAERHDGWGIRRVDAAPFLSWSNKMTKCCGEREGWELANEGGGQLRNPVDISTGQGAEEGGERGGAKAAVKVRDKAGLRETTDGEECSVRWR